MTSRPGVLASVALKGASLFLERALRFAVILAAAPVLGDVAFGRFQYALTLTAFFALVYDLGLGLWTTRALARDTDPLPALRSALHLRALALAPYALACAVAALLAGPTPTRAVLLSTAVAALANTLTDHVTAVLRGRERFVAEALVSVARALLLALFALVALFVGRSLQALGAALALSSLGALLVALAALQTLFPLRELLRGPFPLASALQSLREAFPLSLAGMLSMLYFKGDTVLVRHFVGDAELGLYSAAYKLFEGSMLLPSAVLSVVFPRLARARDNPARQRSLEARTTVSLGLAGSLVALLFALAPVPLVRAFYGEDFLRAAPSLRALSLAVPLVFVNYGLTHFLIARDLGHRNPQLALAMLGINVTANLALVPRLGAVGAAWSTALTELALTAGCVVLLRDPRPRAA